VTLALSDRPVDGGNAAVLSPLERIECLCDPGSVQVLRSRVGDGVVGAAGRVDGRPVFSYAQDSSFAGGSLGTAHAETILRVMDLALCAGAPVVGFVESAGARMQEGLAALGGFGRIFSANVGLSGRVPQISVVTGVSAGGACYSPALTDFVVMVDGASMFLTGPGVVREAIGEDVTAATLGGARVHERSGVCDLVAPSVPAAAGLARSLLSYLAQAPGPAGDDGRPRAVAPPPRAAAPRAVAPPSRAAAAAPLGGTHAPGGAAPAEAPYPPPAIRPGPRAIPVEDPGRFVPSAPRKTYDVRDVIRAVADGGEFLEMAPRLARNMVTGFCRIENRAVAVVANQPRHLGGVIDSDASEKAARFVRTSSSFGLPLVVLVDTPGFMPGVAQESAGVIRHGASLLRAFAEARVPRLTVVLRKAYGGAYITMNSKDLGAHLTFAWSDAELGVMAARQAVGIINRRELEDDASRDELAARYAAEHLGADTAARNGFVDEVIAPSETRARLAWGLSTL
jgi:acetyl-CoA carboxylase carboxyltransferase component